MAGKGGGSRGGPGKTGSGKSSAPHATNTINRSARTGQFVTKADVNRSPGGTVTEHRP